MKRSSCAPTITPIAAASTNAAADPAKTIHLLPGCSAEKSIVANWVLSPISARKTVKKTVKKIRHIASTLRNIQPRVTVLDTAGSGPYVGPFFGGYNSEPVAQW